MTTNINWMPSNYMQRGPSRSEALFEGLKPLGQTAGSYLNSKIDAMHEQKKIDLQNLEQQKSGNALAQMLGTPEKAKWLSQMPIEMQKSFIGQGIKGAGQGPDYTSTFSSLNKNPQEKKIETTSNIPGVPRERQARTNQNQRQGQRHKIKVKDIKAKSK